MKILHLSDTHNAHRQLRELPEADVIVHSGGTHFGSPTLFKRINRISPKLHLFGHIHCANGQQIIGQTKFVNSSLMDESNNLVSAPRIIKL